MQKNKIYYLDSNAHVPMSKRAQEAFINYQNSSAGYGHPSAPSTIGREAASSIEIARTKIAKLLNCSNNQLFFTSTCTQACEWGLKIFNEQAKKRNAVIKSSPMEHPAIKDYVAVNMPQCRFFAVNDGVVVPESDEGFNICLHVQNEIGTIQPIENLKGFVFSDMCQTIGKIKIDLRSFPVDIAVFGAHKFGGPAGIGILYLKDPMNWCPFGTGSRYFKDRTGTPDCAGIVATAAALEDTLEKMNIRLQNMQTFQSVLEEKLTNFGIEVICKNSRRVSNTSFLKIQDCAYPLVQALSEKNIHVGLGSACGSKHLGLSPLMQALGKEGGAGDFIRISQHGDYNADDANFIADIIMKKVNYFRRNYVK